MNKTWSISVTSLLVVVAAAALSFNAMALTKPGAAKATPALSQSYTWYDGNREETVWLNPQLVAEFNPSKQGATAARAADAAALPLPAKQTGGAVRVWKMNTASDVAVRSMTTSHAVGKYSPVFHATSSTGSGMRALPGNIIVYLNPTWDAAAVDGWIKSKKLEVVKKLNIGPNIYVIKTGPGLEALNTANALYLSGEVAAAFPDWWKEVAHR